MTKSNKNLVKAKMNKHDEFFTQMEDIKAELCHYKDHFKNKIILLNCDDPIKSKFFTYFVGNFDSLHLKKLITTGYNENGKGSYYIFDGVNDFGMMSLDMDGDGDFRKEETINYLKEADIVVTNPPFSLFREYIAQLMEYDKKFLIIGGSNAVQCKDIFPLIKEGKVWLGYDCKRDKQFEVPASYSNATEIDGKTMKSAPTFWYTNLEHNKRNERLELVKTYDPESYPKYYNYDAINVDKVTDIPKDYYGEMGVPITFLCKHNPEQFEIIGLGSSTQGKVFGVGDYNPEHKRLVGGKGLRNGTLYMLENDELKIPYGRVVIRKIKDDFVNYFPEPIKVEISLNKPNDHKKEFEELNFVPFYGIIEALWSEASQISSINGFDENKIKIIKNLKNDPTIDLKFVGAFLGIFLEMVLKRLADNRNIRPKRSKNKKCENTCKYCCVPKSMVFQPTAQNYNEKLYKELTEYDNELFNNINKCIKVRNTCVHCNDITDNDINFIIEMIHPIIMHLNSMLSLDVRVVRSDTTKYKPVT